MKGVLIVQYSRGRFAWRKIKDGSGYLFFLGRRGRRGRRGESLFYTLKRPHGIFPPASPL
jgi:hypothetical protein